MPHRSLGTIILLAVAAMKKTLRTIRAVLIAFVAYYASFQVVNFITASLISLNGWTDGTLHIATDVGDFLAVFGSAYVAYLVYDRFKPNKEHVV